MADDRAPTKPRGPADRHARHADDDDRRDPLAAARARLLACSSSTLPARSTSGATTRQRRAVEREIGELLAAGDASATVAATRDRRGLRARWSRASPSRRRARGVGYWQTGSPSLLRRRAPRGHGFGAADRRRAGERRQRPAADRGDGRQARRAHEGATPTTRRAGRCWRARTPCSAASPRRCLPTGARSSCSRTTRALLADYADAVAATKGTANNPESVALIERALAVDPKQPKALALAGTAAYDRGDYRARDRRLAEDRRPAAARQRAAGRGSRRASTKRARTWPAAPRRDAGRRPQSQRPSRRRERRPAPRRRSVSGTVTLDPGARRASCARRLGVRLRPRRRRRPHAARRAARHGRRPAARASRSTTAWRWHRA